MILEFDQPISWELSFNGIWDLNGISWDLDGISMVHPATSRRAASLGGREFGHVEIGVAALCHRCSGLYHQPQLSQATISGGFLRDNHLYTWDMNKILMMIYIYIYIHITIY